MSRSLAPRVERSVAELNGVLRRLATTVRGVTDFERFLQNLGKTLEWISTATDRSIRFDPVLPGGDPPPDAFTGPELNAPVATSAGMGGLIRVAPPDGQRPFGPEDLHLVGTLAEFTGALFDLSTQVRAGEAAGQLLRQVYDQLPVGVICFLPTGAPFLCNARCRVMLEGSIWPSRSDALAFLESRSVPQTAANGPRRYSFATNAVELLAEVHDLQNADGPSCTVIVLAEFESRERNLRQALEREIFRSRWLGQPLAFVALETGGDPARLFARLPDIRQTLKSGDLCDYLGHRQIGFVLPGRERYQALQTARIACRFLTDETPLLKIGCSHLGANTDRVEHIISETLAGLQPAAALLRPRLLVMDRYGAIPETIAMIMRDTFHVEKATDPAEALATLHAIPVDAIVVEHEPDDGISGVEVLNEARALQPEIVGVLTTTRQDLRQALAPLAPDMRVVEKPFSVESLRAALAPVTARHRTETDPK